MIDWLSVYQRPYHICATCVQPNGYNLFLANETYLNGYDTRNFVVHMVYKISSCLQTRNELNEYIYNNNFNKFKYQFINIFPFDWYFKRTNKVWAHPNLPLTKVSEELTGLTNGSCRPIGGLCNELMSPVNFDTRVHTSNCNTDLFASRQSLQW